MPKEMASNMYTRLMQMCERADRPSCSREHSGSSMALTPQARWPKSCRWLARDALTCARVNGATQTSFSCRHVVRQEARTWGVRSLRCARPCPRPLRNCTPVQTEAMSDMRRSAGALATQSWTHIGS